MTTELDRVRISVLFGGAPERRELVVEGAPGDDATFALMAAIAAERGRGNEHLAFYEGAADDDVPLVLVSPPDDLADDEYVVDFVDLPVRTTFADVRMIVGPVPFSVTVMETGFGGDAIAPFVIWVLDDLLPFGSVALELYGAAEIARRIGAAARRRRNRDTRQSADNWVREGGAVPALLIDRVNRDDSWTDDRIEMVFGLDRRDGRKLMKKCGYRWSRTRESYWAPMDEDAVN